MRHVVYTCLFGYSEAFGDFAYEREDGVDYVCFTDDPELRSEFWEIRVVSREMLDAPRAAKRIKALAHSVLPEYDWSLYVDNTVRLKVSAAELFATYLAPSRSPFVCFRHPERDCVYDEAEAVVRFQLDDPQRVAQQMRFYRHLGYPSHAGLATATLLLRRHHDDALIPVMERWHQQVLRHSLRDQLSLNPVAWYDGFELGYIDRAFADFELMERVRFADGERLPRNFDDGRYRELNPDVDMDPRKHYLRYGAAEGRSYT